MIRNLYHNVYNYVKTVTYILQLCYKDVLYLVSYFYIMYTKIRLSKNDSLCMYLSCVYTLSCFPIHFFYIIY